ncbi:ABC transporter permease [Longispora albida]|uniref:ABC transporter permease n=1 Tax=Longispora albida TaxID=203523 RepID=UPI000372D742|nr:iron ABC transporter permease [Longispora albida]
MAAGALLAGAVAVTPLVYLLIRTAEAGWERVAEELLTTRVALLASRSLLLAAVVTTACLVLGAGTAYLVVRTDLPGRRFFGVLAALPLAVPTYVAGFCWIAAVDAFEGFWAAALLLTLCSYPYVYLPVAAALAGADPAQEEVARSLGHGPWRTLTGVTLRQIRPAVAAGGLLVALYVLSDFGAVSLTRFHTFTVAIFTAVDLGFDKTGALVLSTVLVVLTVALLAGEMATRRRGARYARVGSGARHQAPQRKLGAWRWPLAGALSGVAFLSLGVPALSLAQRMIEGVSRADPLGEVAVAAGNSLRVSALGAALSVLLALPVGLYAVRGSGWLPGLLERVSYAGHGLPGLVIGLSLVAFGVHVVYPLYQTTTMLALAYAVLFLPLAVGSVHAAAAQAPPGLEEVARSLGRTPWSVFRTVTIPLTAPGIATGAALVMLTCMKELAATLMLRPTGMDTLATELWTQTSAGAYAGAAPYAALLVALSAIPTWLLVRGNYRELS